MALAQRFDYRLSIQSPHPSIRVERTTVTYDDVTEEVSGELRQAHIIHPGETVPPSFPQKVHQTAAVWHDAAAVQAWQDFLAEQSPPEEPPA